MDSLNSVVHCMQHVLSEKAPFLIIAVLCVLGAVPGLYLPETSDLKMPDSLEDIQEVGRSDINLNTNRRQSLSFLSRRQDRFFWMPLCRGRRRFRKVEKTKSQSC